MQGKNLTFYIANKKYLYYSFYAPDGVAEGATGLKVDRSDWDNGLVPPDVQNKINRLTYLVNQHVSRCQIGDIPITASAITDIINSENHKKGKAVSSKKSFVDVVLAYYEGIKKGEILNEDTPYSESMVRLVENVLDDFGHRANAEKSTFKAVKVPPKIARIGRQSINDFSEADLLTYRAVLLERGVSQNTLSIRNNIVLTILKKTKKQHDNRLYREEDLRISAEEVDYGVVYTVEELERIYSKVLPQRMGKYRDVFVAGSFLCLRHVDHRENNLIDWVQGDFMTLNTQKTGKNVAIPLHPIVKEILAKYPNGLPQFTDVAFRMNIKEICKGCGFDDLVLFSRTQGGKKISEMKPRYKLTGTHTMRRNFATNALLAGVPKDWVMKIGGWKSVSSFEKYNRMTIKQVAEQAIKHPFFSQGFGNQ